MKYVFVGDIHGKVEAVEAALAKDGKKIFVGDFIDSFDRTVEQHKKCYDLVFDAIEKGEAEACFGNHELSYILPERHRCSGYGNGREILMTHYGPICQKYFKPYILLQPDFLVSHAGLNRILWRSFNLSLETLPETLAKWWPDLKSPIHWIGQYRGGDRDTGGLFWCDFRTEFKPIEELKQVFGHTRGQGIRRTGGSGNSYCVDCLDFTPRGWEFLEMDI